MGLWFKLFELIMSRAQGNSEMPRRWNHLPTAVGMGICAMAMITAMSEAMTQGENMSLGEKADLALPPLIKDTPIVKMNKLNGMLSTEAQNTALGPNTASQTG